MNSIYCILIYVCSFSVVKKLNIFIKENNKSFVYQFIILHLILVNFYKIVKYLLYVKWNVCQKVLTDVEHRFHQKFCLAYEDDPIKTQPSCYSIQIFLLHKLHLFVDRWHGDTIVFEFVRSFNLFWFYAQCIAFISNKFCISEAKTTNFFHNFFTASDKNKLKPTRLFYF